MPPKRRSCAALRQSLNTANISEPASARKRAGKRSNAAQYRRSSIDSGFIIEAGGEGEWSPSSGLLAGEFGGVDEATQALGLRYSDLIAKWSQSVVLPACVGAARRIGVLDHVAGT